MVQFRKTTFRHFNCFLSSLTTDGKVNLDMKFDKVHAYGAEFQVFLLKSGYACKNHLRTELYDQYSLTKLHGFDIFISLTY